MSGRKTKKTDAVRRPEKDIQEEKKKAARKQRRYRAAVEGFTSIIHLLILVLVLLIIVFLGRYAYRFGYAVFYEKRAEEPPGRDIVVTIPEMPSARDVGEVLREAGLIEDVRVFVVQERLSAYHDKEKAGEYTLNTSMTPTEMLSVIGAEEDKETEPSSAG